MRVEIRRGSAAMMDVSAAIVPINEALHFRSPAHQEIIRVCGANLQHEAFRTGKHAIGDVVALQPVNTPYKRAYLSVAYPHQAREIIWGDTVTALTNAVKQAASEGHGTIGIPFCLDAPWAAFDLSAESLAKALFTAALAAPPHVNVYIFAHTEQEHGALDRVKHLFHVAEEKVEAVVEEVKETAEAILADDRTEDGVDTSDATQSDDTPAKAQTPTTAPKRPQARPAARKTTPAKARSGAKR